MRRRPLAPPPQALRRARLDNLALVPANLLPYKEHWQQVANRLPNGAVLIVLPDNPAQKNALLAVAKLLSAEGHQVRVLPAEEVRRQPHYEQAELEL